MDHKEEPVIISDELLGASEPHNIVRFLATGDNNGDPYTSAIIVATVSGVLFFQAIFRKLDNWVEGKRHAKEVLAYMFRELAILGIVAFVLFAIESSERAELDADYIHVFDFIHMAIFFITVLYTVFCGVILYLSTVTGRKWKYLEDIDIHNYNNLSAQYNAINHKLGLEYDTSHSRFKLYYVSILHPVLVTRRRSLIRHVAYQEVRENFIRENNLPANFRFVIYLDKCKQDVVLQLATIGEATWITLVVFVALSMYIQAVRNTTEMNIFLVVLVLALLPVLVVLLVREKVNWVYEEVLYAENYFSEELKEVIQLQNLFWLKDPKTIILASKFAQFSLSVAAGVYIQLITTFTGYENIIVVVAILFASLFYVATLPQVINDFSMVSHVCNLVDKQLLASALLKQQSEFKTVSTAPTLRQATILAKERLQKMTIKKRISNVMASSFFCDFINYCILFDFTIVSLRLAISLAEGQATWTWTWYESLEIAFSCLFLVEGLLIIYVLGFRSIIRNQHRGALFDLIIIFVISASSFCTAIYLSLGNPSSRFDPISYLDLIVVLRLVRWTHRILLSDSLSDEDLEANLSEVKILLEEQTDPRSLVEYMENNSITSKDAEPTPTHIARKVFYSPRRTLNSEHDVDERFIDVETPPKEENIGCQQVSYAQTERERRTGPDERRDIMMTHPAWQQTRRYSVPRNQNAILLDGDTNHEVICTPVMEAWMRTCELHPDVTAIHGNISVAVLRLMLNLPAEKKRNLSTSRHSAGIGGLSTSTRRETSSLMPPRTSSVHGQDYMTTSLSGRIESYPDVTVKDPKMIMDPTLIETSRRISEGASESEH